MPTSGSPRTETHMNTPTFLRSLAICASLLLATPTRAQSDETAIRQTSQISVLEMANGINAYYTVTVRTSSDCVIWRNSAGTVLRVEFASQLRARAWQVVTHSSGNVSFRLTDLGQRSYNGGTIELVSRGVVVDRDRIRVY